MQGETSPGLKDSHSPLKKFTASILVLAVFAVAAVGAMLATEFVGKVPSMLQSPGQSQGGKSVAAGGPAKTISPADAGQATLAALNGTLCSVGTKSSGYVGMYALFGTLTRTPTSTPEDKSAVAMVPTETLTPTSSSYSSDAMSTAMAALPTTVLTATPTVARYISPTPPPPNPDRGKVIFNGTGACNACHEVNTDTKLVGPSLNHIASFAASRRPGVSAEDYLKESIVSPNFYLVPGYTGGVMPVSYDRTMSQQQIADVVAYMMTLK